MDMGLGNRAIMAIELCPPSSRPQTSPLDCYRDSLEIRMFENDKLQSARSRSIHTMEYKVFPCSNFSLSCHVNGNVCVKMSEEIKYFIVIFSYLRTHFPSDGMSGWMRECLSILTSWNLMTHLA
jgi:hypothetical protein